MINTDNERLIAVRQANRLIPGRPSPKTVWRWALHGLKDGRKLESVMVGGHRMTSREAIKRFMRHDGPFVPRPPRKPDTERQREIALAVNDIHLDDLGI